MKEDSLTDTVNGVELIEYRLIRAESVEELLGAIFRVLSDTSMRRLGWRGQANSSWPIRTGLFRRLSRLFPPEAMPEGEELNDFKLDLIKRSMALNYYSENYPETWARLQHHGAATHLLDISRDPFVALWFAVSGAYYQQSSEYASVYALNVSDMYHLTVFDGPNSGHFTDSEIIRRGIVYTPAWTNERMKAQRASFLSWEPYDMGIEQVATENATTGHGWKIEFPVNLCEEILEFLKLKFDLSEMTLFPDFDGFAMSHSVGRDPFLSDELLRFER